MKDNVGWDDATLATMPRKGGYCSSLEEKSTKKRNLYESFGKGTRQKEKEKKEKNRREQAGGGVDHAPLWSKEPFAC